MAVRSAISVLAVVALLAACGQAPEGSTVESVGAKMVIWTDQGTGCDYVIMDGYNAGDITVRLGANGLPVCNPGLRGPQ